MVIALDGPAGSGKSTLAKKCAEKLGINFLNTGMIFRAIAYEMDKNHININNENEIKKFLDKILIDVEYKDGEQIVYIDGESTLNYIALPKIAKLASEYSQLVPIRTKVCEIQRQFSKKYDLVVEGRDIGTEVFPNAEYKFFVTASIDVRAKRRIDDILKKGEIANYEDIKQSLIERDYNDTHRKISPLKMADDAILIDTSNETAEQSLNKILSYIK